MKKTLVLFAHLVSWSNRVKSISLRRGLFLLILAAACNEDIVIATIDGDGGSLDAPAGGAPGTIATCDSPADDGKQCHPNYLRCLGPVSCPPEFPVRFQFAACRTIPAGSDCLGTVTRCCTTPPGPVNRCFPMDCAPVDPLRGGL